MTPKLHSWGLVSVLASIPLNGSLYEQRYDSSGSYAIRVVIHNAKHRLYHTSMRGDRNTY